MIGRVTDHVAKEDLCRMNGTMDGYGPHLMLDLGECNPALLDDLEACFNLLNELPKKISLYPTVVFWKKALQTGLSQTRKSALK